MRRAPSCIAVGDKGPAVLFLHGIGGDAECFRPQLAHFGRVFRAVAWDLPGYGGPDLAARLMGGLIGPTPDADGMAIALASMSRVPPETYRAALECLVAFDRRDALPRIAVPTLLIAGAADTTAPAAVMERMAAKIPG